MRLTLCRPTHRGTARMHRVSKTGLTGHFQNGFTLIELLVVIAIIAILAAIIFPAFAGAQESARRATSISNMHQIQVAIKQYRLDNRQYPPFLFGPAIKSDGAGGCATFQTSGDLANMIGPATFNNLGYRVGDLIPAQAGDDVCSMVQAGNTGKMKGLYPEYIKSLDTFSCPDNDFKNANDASKTTAVAAASRLENTDSTTTPPTVSYVPYLYYRYDAYDASPQVMDTNGTIDKTKMVVRYSRLWYPLVTNPCEKQDGPTCDLANGERAFYARQLYWRTPSDDAYVTATSYHAPKTKMLVLWLGGAAKVLDVKKLNDKVPNGSTTDYNTNRLLPTD